MEGKEIRLHGRGGQGAVLAARMLASAFALEGKSVASFPMYGFERRGMPVIAFTRFDTKVIQEKTQIYTPDLLMVVDPTLLSLKTLFDGLKPAGTLILNSARPLETRPSANLGTVGWINATQVALCEIGKDIPQHLSGRCHGQGDRMGIAGFGRSGVGRVPGRDDVGEQHP